MKIKKMESKTESIDRVVYALVSKTIGVVLEGIGSLHGRHIEIDGKIKITTIKKEVGCPDCIVELEKQC